MGIILAILIFSFIVFFHELGHFVLAKKNGIDVEEFAIGMGPLLYSREYKADHWNMLLLEKQYASKRHYSQSLKNIKSRF